MTRDQIQTAINEGIPFLIRMADGERYDVSDRYQVALGKPLSLSWARMTCLTFSRC